MAGSHLVADFLAKNEVNALGLRQLMEAIVKRLSLHVVESWTQVFPNGGEFGPGITAMMILSESHFVIHTAPERQGVNLDLFSCREFDEAMVRESLEGCFDVTHYTRWLVLKR